MLQVKDLSKSYGAETILSEIRFVINPGDRAALVGPNGSGKSTLLRIIAGEEPPDSGSVAVKSGARLGYLPQGLPLREDQTVETVIRSGLHGWDQARLALERAAEALGEADSRQMEAAMERYSRALVRFDSLGGYEIGHRIEKVASGLGLENDLDRRVADLSGGQRTRAGLARILLAEPDLLLLDEPTNHLDIEALEWLEAFLADFPGAALLVSHDRVFLDRTVTRVIALDLETHTAREYPGTYSDYAAAAARELAKTWQNWQDQQAEIRRLEADIHRTKMHALSVELTTTSGQPTVRRYAKKVARKAISREKKLERYLESDERVEKPKAGWQMKLDFDETDRSGQIVLEIEGLNFGYPGSELLLRDVNLNVQYGDRIALVGRNGSGKSTLLRLITGALQPAQGRARIGSSVRLGYMPQEQETIPAHDTPLSVIQAARPMSETEARNFLHYFLFEGDAALLPANKLSYGERARLILAKLVVAGSNFLVLDEPVNHLDIPSRERFEAALDAFPGTVLAAVHDRAFISQFAERVLLVERGRIFEPR